MRIVILGLNYLPETTSIGPYTADLAEFLLQRGHSVHVITGFPTAPNWRVWDGYRGKRLFRETINGVPITRTYLHVPADPKNTRQRIVFDSSFAVSALLGAMTGPRPDAVLVISPPLQLGITGLIAGALRRAKVYLHIQDLVPDAAIAVGALRPDGRAARAALRLERWIYERVDSIGVITNGMRQNLLDKGVPSAKIHTIPNYIDITAIRRFKGDNGFRTRFGVPETDFLAMYSGSISGKQGLETFVEAAAGFEGNSGIRCCLIGDGAALPKLKEQAERRSLQNFQFIPMQPRNTLVEQLSAADTLVLTQQRTVKDAVFPGKLLYYMAVARPIVAAVSEDSETGKFVRQNAIGVVVPPEAPEQLAGAIRWLRDNPAKAQQFGKNGRRVAEAQFDRQQVLEKFATYLEGSN